MNSEIIIDLRLIDSKDWIDQTVELNPNIPVLVNSLESDISNQQFIIKDNQIIEGEDIVGLYVKISSPKDMQKLMETDLSNFTYVFTDTEDWKIIPLENLIAKLRQQKVKLWCTATTLDEIKLVKEILEIGVDTAVIPPELVKEFIKNSEASSKTVELQEFEVISIEKVGSGDRVCIDTTALLKPGEGMLIGSTSKVFLLIEAEVHESGYVNARPFRVNAGPVSSYILNLQQTNYLSELGAGIKVMVVRRDGSIREELVGRVKIERRPLLLIKVKINDGEYPILVQDAETVRMITTDGSLSVSELKIGDKVLGTVEKLGRHFGIPVDEFIDER
jgi:3-dehydroquinate synthase II